MTPDDALTTVQTALEGARPKGSVPLSPATLGTQPGRRATSQFAGQLGSDTVTLTQQAKVDLDPTAHTLTVSGATLNQPLLGAPGPTVTAVLTAVPDPEHPGSFLLHVAMRIDPGSNWTFATTFSHLAKSDLQGLTLQASPAPYFMLRTTAGPADAYGPLAPVGLSLSMTATIDGASLIKALAPLVTVSPGTSIALSGPVSANPDGESVALRGSFGNSPTAPLHAAGLPAITLSNPDLTFAGGAAHDDKGIWGATVNVGVWGSASVGGSALPFGVSVPVTASGVWELFLIPGLGVSFQQLATFVPGLSLVDAIPDELKSCLSVELTVFSISLYGSPGSMRPAALQLQVGAPEPWTLVRGIAAIERVEIALAATMPATGPAQITGHVAGALGLGSHDLEIDIYVPLPLGGPITLSSYPQLQLPGIGAIAGLIGGTDLESTLPKGVADIGSFVLDGASLTVDPTGPSLTNASIDLSAGGWTIVPGWVSLQNMHVDFAVSDPFKNAVVTGAVGGWLQVGPAWIVIEAQKGGAAGWELTVNAEDIPPVSLGDLEHLAGVDLSPVVPHQLADKKFTISQLDLSANLSRPSFERFDIVIHSDDQPWQIFPSGPALDSIAVGLTIDHTSGSPVASGFLTAELEWGPAAVVFEADYQGGSGWELSGQLESPLELGQIVSSALDITVPHGLDRLSVTSLSVSYTTADENYSIAGAVGWKPEIPGVRLEIGASASLSRTTDANAPDGHAYQGRLEGDLKSHWGSDQLEVSVAYEFTKGATTAKNYVFKLGFNGITFTGTMTSSSTGDTIVTVRLGGLTFGEIVEYLVNLVEGTTGFKLPAPWDVLDKINFDDLALVLNVTQRTVGIEVDIKENLGLVDIETLTLTYLHKGGGASVDIAMTGSFAGTAHTKDNPLKWDMLNDSPPAAPGAGAALLDVDYLGVGQHLVIADPSATRIPAVMKALEDTILQPKGRPPPWKTLSFDSAAGWLFGADIIVMGTVTVQVVFDDPEMYGARIALAGQKAGSFAGLDFEILYRKLSNTLGVYHVELKLPDVMRHLEFGEVSVTLPVVILDIYTDGGFKIDLGFPYGGDWSVCFGLEVFPFVGAGGSYFAKLNSGVGADVPQITNGTFGPVIEFGVALAVGVGKDFEEGPLSAGMSLTVQGILQGVVAWFNPSDKSLPSDRYYKIDGSIAIIGKLYGTVDFKIIRVSLSVVAQVSAAIEVAAYAPILIDLSVDVEVEASIKILFIRIHFSFGLHLNASFTIGSAQATPWHIGTPAPESSRLAANRPSLLARAELPHHALAAARPMLATAVGAPVGATWTPMLVLDQQAKLDITLAPAFTVADGGVTAVMLAVVPTDAPTEHASADELREAARAGGNGTRDIPFNRLIESLIKWGMQTRTGGHSGTITAVDLAQIYASLAAPGVEYAADGFLYSNVAKFLGDNFTVDLQAPPPDDNGGFGSAVMPIPPPLTMTPQDTAYKVDFGASPEVGSTYLDEVAQLLAQSAVDYDASRAHDPLAPAPPAPPAPVQERITEALFGDWMLLVAKASVQAASDALKRFAWDPATDEPSMALAAAKYAPPTLQYRARDGDTSAFVAALFGITAKELVAANGDVDWNALGPKVTLTVPTPMAYAPYVVTATDALDNVAKAWGVTDAAITNANPHVTFAPGASLRIPVPELLFHIAEANAGAPLAAAQLPIAGLTHAVVVGETLRKIGGLYGVTAADIATANATNSGVLRPGAMLNVGSAAGPIPYLVATGDTYELIAAYTVARAGPISDPYLTWFENTIASDPANAAVDFSGTIASGTTVTVPVASVQSGVIVQTGTTTDTTKPGDTLALVAAMWVELDLHAAAVDTLAGNIKTANNNAPLTPGTTIGIPVQQHKVAPGDTFKSLADRFGLTPADLGAANADQDVLALAAALALPPGTKVTVAEGATLTSTAAALGLTVDELAGRIGGIAGLFDTSASLTIPGARAIDIEALMDILVASATNGVASMASHMMLHGLQLPSDLSGANTAKLSPLYALTGQQFPAPGTPENYDIFFDVDTPNPWIAAAHLDAPVSETAMSEHWPDTTLQNPLTGPFTGAIQVFPMTRAAPVRHALSPPVSWTAGQPPTLPGGSTGGSFSLWRLPPSLIAQVEAAATPPAYDMMTAPKGSAAAAPEPVASYAWATWLPLTIRRVAAPGGGWIPGTYVLVGAGEADRDVLLELWQAVATDTGQTPQLFLLHAGPSPSDQLVADALDTANTAVLKTNTSTTTHSGPDLEAVAAAAVGTPPPGAFARISDAAGFLGLAWEASVTGSGGFYLTYAAQGGAPLPDSVFGAGDDAELWLVALLGEQTQTPHTDRTLRPYTTGAVAAGTLDTTKVSVFAQAESRDTVRAATGPPGNVAFAGQRPNANTDTTPTVEQQLTRQLFSLLDWKIDDNAVFKPPPLTLPVGPATTNPDDPSAGNDNTTWYYHQAIPVASLVTPPATQRSSALPPVAGNPYLGIGPTAELPLEFAFRDAFGNQIVPDAPVPPLSVPVRYYDALLGLVSWPAATGTYLVDKVTNAAELGVMVELGVSKYVPGGANSYATAVRTAAAHQLTYERLYYQLGQPDVSCSVATSLDAPGTVRPELADLTDRALAFAAGAYVYLGTAQNVHQAEFTVTEDSDTLQAIAAPYRATVGQLAAANAAADASLLFAEPLQIPLLLVVQPGMSIGALAAAAPSDPGDLLAENADAPFAAAVVLDTAPRHYTTSAGDTLASVAALMDDTPAGVAGANATRQNVVANGAKVACGTATVTAGGSDTLTTLAQKLAAAAGKDVTVTDLAAANTTVALFVPGSQLAIAAVEPIDGDDAGARSHQIVGGETLGHIASTESCTVAGLALANAQDPKVLNPKATFTFPDPNGKAPITVQVGDGGTFASVVAAFAAPPKGVVLGVADLAAAGQGDGTLLAPDATLAITDYVTQTPSPTQAASTPASVVAAAAPGLKMDRLAALNAPRPAGAFPDGAVLSLGMAPSYTPKSGDTLASIAAAHRLTVDQLAAANATTGLVVGGIPPAQVAIPGVVTLPAHATFPVQIEFGPDDGPTLDALATDLGVPSADLAALNPGLGGGALPAGALVVTPPPVVGAHTAVNALAAVLGVDAVDLVAANAALAGLVALNVQFSDKVTSTSEDTLGSIIAALAAADLDYDAEAFVEAWGDKATLNGSAAVIVPPARLRVSAAFADVHVPAPFTPLEVTLTVRRDPAWLDLDIPPDDPVGVDTTPLAPYLGEGRSAHPLAWFADKFEKALASARLKLATGPQPDEGTRGVWVVDFGASGFEQVKVDGTQPRFYALPPVSRQLQSGTADVGEYDPGSGNIVSVQEKQFRSVDLDALLRAFFEGVDALLDPASAVAAWRQQPAAFDRIVAAKDNIAGQLSQLVVEILDEFVDGPAIQAARDALADAMRERLASAYTTDAVVQFPANVSSPFVRGYEIQPGDGFQQIGDYYGVSRQGAAQGLATAPLIVAPKVTWTATASGKTYYTTAGDTLSDVAAALGVPVITLPDGTTTSDTPFASGVPVGASSLARATAANETFATLATAFMADPATVGTAVQDVSGLLASGAVVCFGNQSHQVGTNETLRQVAGALSTTAGVLAADPGVVAQPNLIAAGQPVHCFPSRGPVAPRLSGKPAAEVYRASAGDGVAAPLAYYKVSVEALADALADAQGVLAENTSVTYQGTTQPIATGDTLRTLAAKFPGPPTPAALLAGIDPHAPLLRQNASIPVGRVSMQAVATDSFETAAARLGVDPVVLAVAIEDRGGLLAPNTVVSYDGNTCTIKGGETLAQVGSAVGATVTQLAEQASFLQTPSLFASGAELNVLQEMPNLSLSTAKATLANEGGPLSLLFATDSDAEMTSIFLDLDYSVNAIEFQIDDVAGTGGYQESDWLHFPVPLGVKAFSGSVDLEAGQTQVPIPLRAYPQIPSITAQRALQTFTAATTATEAKQWDLSVDVTHQSAAQDELLLDVDFTGAAVSAPPQTGDALFGPLVQFDEVWAGLRHDLARLPATAATDTVLQNALLSFAGIAESIQTAVAAEVAARQPRPVPAVGTGDGSHYDFVLDTTYDRGATPTLASVDLTVPDPGDTVDSPWPAIYVGDAPGPLDADPPEKQNGKLVRRYHYPPGQVPAFAPLARTFVFPDTAVDPDLEKRKGRDAVHWQAGETSVSVRRNADLIPGRPTNKWLVYETPPVAFPNPAVPQLLNAQPIAGPVGRLDEALAAVLTDLLTENGVPLGGEHRLRVSCRYERPLGDGEQVLVQLPLFLAPLVSFDHETIAEFARAAQTQVDSCLSHAGIIPRGAERYVLDVAVYASGDQALTRPLVELSDYYVLVG
ncbi:MAG: LysM peptidoglycan-binding domain-containing protein [Solirubrobacteraceae bacterium]